MADSKPTIRTPVFEYRQLIWGDLIYGTKDQIQALGIGEGLSFPGEIGGPRNTLKVPDPRGFPVWIKDASYHGEGAFVASIRLFEECPRPEPIAQPYAPGVTKCEFSYFDEYRGTAEALAACGMVRLNQLPGQPGMRKVSVRILPDGSVHGGPPTAYCAEAKAPGAKLIQRAGVDMFRVEVRITPEQCQQRQEHQEIATREWEERIRALPRPAPLTEEGLVRHGAEQRQDVANPEKWLEAIEDFICDAARASLSGTSAQIQTKSGLRYSINLARAQNIIQAIETAAQRIRELPVKVEKIVTKTKQSNERARDRAGAASADGAFQRFLQRATEQPGQK